VIGEKYINIIPALSDVASEVSDDEAKSEIAENAKRFPVSTDQPRTLSGPAGRY
jgi:hypothetical protein